MYTMHTCAHMHTPCNKSHHLALFKTENSLLKIIFLADAQRWIEHCKHGSDERTSSFHDFVPFLLVCCGQYLRGEICMSGTTVSCLNYFTFTFTGINPYSITTCM